MIEVKNNADSMIYQTKKLMEDNKEKIEANEKSQIEAAIKSLEEDIKSDDIQRIKLGIENLQKSMYSFSQRIYTSQAQDQVYQQAAEQAQKAASGMGGVPPEGMGGVPHEATSDTGAGGATYKKDKKEDEKKKKGKVVDVDWDED
jgi:molecular chaperone DnaK